MKILSLTSLLLVISVPVLTAQMYNTSGGVRIGDDFGINFAQRIANKNTVEVILQPGTFTGNEMYAALLRQHYPLITKRINFYLGGGVYTRSQVLSSTDIPVSTGTTGLALTFGGELTVGRFNLSTDFLPLVVMGGKGNQRFQSSSGVSIRYVMWGRESGFKKFFKKIFRKK